jgi:hypothetical protein
VPLNLFSGASFVSDVDAGTFDLVELALVGDGVASSMIGAGNS